MYKSKVQPKSGKRNENGQHHSKSSKEKDDKERKGSNNCYNCNKEGHRASHCPDKEKGPACLKCDKWGHIAKNCSQSKSDESTAKKKSVSFIEGGMSEYFRQYKQVYFGAFKESAMIDSGAKVSIIREDTLEQIKKEHGEELQIKEYLGSLDGFGGSTVKPSGVVTLKTQLDGAEYDLEYGVVPTNATSERILIGYPLRNVAKIILERGKTLVEPIVGPQYVNLIKEEQTDIERAIYSVPQQYVREIQSLVENYKPEAKEEVSVELTVKLTDETPIYRNPRRLAPKENVEVSQQIEEWLKEGVIEPSTSEFASQVVVARKKDGTPRVCINYGPLNKVLVKERTPMPIVEDVLDDLSEVKVFSIIDLKNRFLHLSVGKGSRKYLAFVTPDGQYQFRQVSFGLATSPGVFARFLRYIFAELIRKKILIVFFDVGVILAKTFAEALDNLRKVLEVAAHFGSNINWKKCQLLQTRA